MILSTTSTLEGRRVAEYLGLVSGQAILGANVFRDFFAGVRDIVGGRVGGYEKVLHDGRDAALADLIEEAKRLGANAVIGIARAILRDPPVLPPDEATSALDAESERKVQQAVEGLMRGHTTVVIAHRLATVQKANRIVVMDRGRIVATGGHTELMAQDGLYARFARRQFAAA